MAVYFDQRGDAFDDGVDLQSLFGNLPPPTMPENKSLIGSALTSGAYDLGSLGASALEAGAGLVGAKGVQDWAKATAASQAQKAQEAGREDLEQAPWYDPDRKSTRLNSSHVSESRMPSSA